MLSLPAYSDALARARDKKRGVRFIKRAWNKNICLSSYIYGRGADKRQRFSTADREVNTLRPRSYLVINRWNFRAYLLAPSLCIHISDDIERPDDFVKYRAFNESRAHRPAAAGGITDAVR